MTKSSTELKEKIKPEQQKMKDLENEGASADKKPSLDKYKGDKCAPSKLAGEETKGAMDKKNKDFDKNSKSMDKDMTDFKSNASKAKAEKKRLL